MSAAKPPPPPPPRRRAPTPNAAPAKETPPPPSMSPGEKQALTVQALGLLNEQIEARIVHYRADLKTSPELDAVTAQVVQQLKALQAAARSPGPRASSEEVERQQVTTLTQLLGRLFVKDGNFAMQNLKAVGRRIAKLFFESELHEKSKGDKDKKIYHAEQGVYYVLQRYKRRLSAELAGFEYVNDDIRQLTADLLAKIERDLQVGFLSRRSPELNKVMTIYTGVLTEFIQDYLPSRIEQMARHTIANAGTARRPDSIAYKVLVDAFPDFRREWERLLMQHMVSFCGDELIARLGSSQETFRDETIKFFTDPHVFSETCEVLCDALYDYLCLEGFLDLPVDWRASFGRES